MKTNQKRWTIILFCVVLFGTMLINLLTGDQEISFAERRTLATRPKLTREWIFSGKAADDTEQYLLDQIAFRQTYRRVKTFFDRRVFLKKDSDGIYLTAGHIFKTEYPLREDSVVHMAEKMNRIYELYLRGSASVSYAVIPDKNYFAPKQEGYLGLDYARLESVLAENVKNMDYVSLFDGVLSLEDYYRTDLHWKQDRLEKVTAKLGEHLGLQPMRPFEKAYTKKTYEPFYGAYYGQAASFTEPDTLTYLSNPTLSQAIVTNLDETAKDPVHTGVYGEDHLGGVDSYEVFLYGNAPIMTVENPKNKEGRELVLFRDSFGSSLAPLLLERYSKITLIDLRFVPYRFLGEWVELGKENQDVLFLYSVGVVNQSDMIRE